MNIPFVSKTPKELLRKTLKPKIIAPLVSGMVGISAGCIHNIVDNNRIPERRQVPTMRAHFLKAKNLDHEYKISSIAGKQISPRIEVFHGGDKIMDHLTREEAYALGAKIFGKGQGLDLLIAIDEMYHGEGRIITRFITLGIHEGALHFQRRNDDPAVTNGSAPYHGSTTSNIGTFQQYDPNNVERKYKKNLEYGLEIYQKVCGISPNIDTLSTADMDIIAHIGYIVTERERMYGGNGSILEALAKKDLSDQELSKLMHWYIQGGISNIGSGVISMLRKGYQVQWSRKKRQWVRVPVLVNSKFLRE